MGPHNDGNTSIQFNNTPRTVKSFAPSPIAPSPIDSPTRKKGGKNNNNSHNNNSHNNNSSPSKKRFDYQDELVTK